MGFAARQGQRARRDGWVPTDCDHVREDAIAIEAGRPMASPQPSVEAVFQHQHGAVNRTDVCSDRYGRGFLATASEHDGVLDDGATRMVHLNGERVVVAPFSCNDEWLNGPEQSGSVGASKVNGLGRGPSVRARVSYLSRYRSHHHREVTRHGDVDRQIIPLEE